VIPTLDQLRAWLIARENEHLEFKEARNSFHFEKLAKYCAALANEGGGSIVLGVTDRRPRRVVGSSAFENLERTKAGLVERLRLKIEGTEIQHPDGRVVVFTAPARQLGVPVSVEGAYWMRAGEDLVPMTGDMLRTIFNELRPDFTAEVCDGASVADLDPLAIEDFRQRWHATAGLPSILTRPPEQLLRDAELIVEGGVTYAAIVLLGSTSAISRYLAVSEIVFEYRSGEAPGPANQREEFRCAFLLSYDRVWNLIDLRNDKQHYLYRFVMVPVPTVSEQSAREALLNAVAHRDYRDPGSIFVRQFPRRLEIVSPGGFPPGITVENMLYQQKPRNRRLADAFARCGLVERAGQGADCIYEECVRQGKPLPDFTHTDTHQVSLTLHGSLADDGFLQFLHRLKDENIDVAMQDLLVFDCVRRGERPPKALRPWLRRLMDRGVLESSGRGAGTRYMFSRRFYTSEGRTDLDVLGAIVDREAHKSLLLKYVHSKVEAGARFEELQQVLPGVGRIQVQRLMRELRREGLVESRGETKGTRWFTAANVAIPP
jgi:ATP-dependent DNA helicase RecG